MTRWTDREKIRGMWRLGILLICAALALAQDPRPQFDVASIHLADPKARPGVGFASGRFSANNISIRLLIEMAYQLQPFRLAGVPAWIDSDLYTIQATWPSETIDNKFREMLQRLLEDRLRLKMKREAKEQNIYSLRIRDETKLQPTKAPGRSMTRANVENRSVRTEFIATTLDRFSDALSRELNRFVVNETGLTGEYDLVLQTEREVDEKNMFTTPLAPSLGQIGLKLESRKGPVEFYTIESIERPSEN